MSRLAQDEALAPNPLEPTTTLLPGSASAGMEQQVHPQKVVAPGDSAVTRAEKYERHAEPEDFVESRSKRIKLDVDPEADADAVEQEPTLSERQKGVAPIKAESVSAPTNQYGLHAHYPVGSFFASRVSQQTRALP